MPIYFVGDTPQGPRLFREFRQVEADNPMAEAVALMTAGDADDPDYGTLYPEGSFADVSFSEGAGAIVVQVKDDAWSAVPRRHEQAGRQARRPAARLHRPGRAAGPAAGAGAERQRPGAALRGPDRTAASRPHPRTTCWPWSTSPSPQQDSEPGATFTASGVANSFEATVPWEIRDEDGKKVLDGFATADGWGDHLYPWQSEVDASSLAPGTYTFVAMTDDPSDGEGGGPTEDTKTFTLH